MTAVSAEPASAGQRPGLQTWTPTFVLFLAYLFAILTGRFPLGAVVMVAAIASLFLQRATLRTPGFLGLFAAWTLWAALGYVLTPYPEVVGESLTERAKLVLVTLVAVNALRRWTQIHFFILFVLVSYVVFPARSTLVNYVHGYTLFGRAIGPFIYGNPNDLAAHTILVLGPALALWTGAPRGSPIRWVALASGALLVLVIVLTQSRGAFLALGIMSLPTTMTLVRRRPRAIAGVAAVLGLALYLAPASFWARMQGLRKATSVATIGEMDPEGSARQRFAVLQTATRIIRDHPVLGVGLGAYEVAQYRYNPSLGYLDTHNTYLNVLAETGLPGLVLFLAVIINVLRGVQHARRRAMRQSPAQAEALRWLQYALFGYLTAGVFGSFSRLAFLYVYLALLWCASRTTEGLGLPTSPVEAPPGRPKGAPIGGTRGGGWLGSLPQSR
ncbi:MAG TPA: O-antigen ligase family protein [Gemmatimonadales bacterium]|nr:O-antigen ligase family protein [Gemmatimonadales bacterium]